jgi:hypothetical protein
MEKIKKITETREVEIVEEVICNQCGEVIEQYSSYLGARMSGGYGSRIGDGVDTSFDICEDCVIKMMKTFKIPPTQNEAGWLGGGIVDDDGNPLL